ncbi:MAG: glutathione S-transferase family protein [Myxococcota bacterium]
MSHLALYFSPGACSRVAMIALELLGLPFESRLVRFARGEHRSPAFLAVNPKGKVPALVVDGRALTENVAILMWLARTHPDGGLLPLGRSEWDDAQVLSDLAWCASNIHALVTRVRMPVLVSDQPESHARVRAVASAQLALNLQVLEDRLADAPWLLGAFSGLDAYAYWCLWRSIDGGFDATAFPRLRDHLARCEAREDVCRALAREAEGARQLAADLPRGGLSP